MKIRLMKVVSAVILSAAISAPSVMSANDGWRDRAKRQGRDVSSLVVPSRYELANPDFAISESSRNSSLMKPRLNASGKPEIPDEMKNADRYGYIDVPDGTYWYYVGNVTKERKDYSETVTGYQFTIFDSSNKKVGEIGAKLELGEGETRIFNVDLDAVMTRKFFNSDDRYELMVLVIANTPQYVNNLYTLVHSIGVDEPVDTIQGQNVGSVNAAINPWDEDFYMTFLNERVRDGESYLDLTTYGKAGWGRGPRELGTISLESRKVLDGLVGTPFIATAHNGAPCFVTCEYEKNFFASDDPSDDTLTPDNAILLKRYDKDMKLVSDTRVPTLLPEKDDIALYRMYGIGMLDYNRDVSFGMWSDDDSPVYVVTVDEYIPANDGDLFSFEAYDVEGRKIGSIFDRAESLLMISDIDGFERQRGFVTGGEEEGTFDYYVVDLPSLKKKKLFNSRMDNNVISASIDRYPKGDSFEYAAWMSRPVDNDNGDLMCLVNWFDREGRYLRGDSMPVGEDVALVSGYISKEVLSPYLVNTDEEREYFLLIKRYDHKNGTSTTQELLIESPSGKVSLRLLPDDELGVISMVNFVNMETNPTLWIVYANDNGYSSKFYSLPLDKFPLGGSGTASDPYRISTLGDLQQIASKPSANYVLANDIDASSDLFSTIIPTFTGVLDGNGYRISNLKVVSRDCSAGIFASVGEGAQIKNLVFDNAEVMVAPSNLASSLVAARAYMCSFSNITVNGLKVTGSADGLFGTIVGQVTNTAKISLCSVSQADIDLPKASGVGGIAGDLRTGVSITASAFSGSINAMSSLGGIAGSSISSDETISNCHVDARLVAQSVVGGIIGQSARGPVTNCYVEGSITALVSDKFIGACAGGVVGELNIADPSKSEMGVPVKGNVVALSSITVPEQPANPAWANRYDTAHRVVGKTVVNEEPEGMEYDENGNPVPGTGKPHSPDGGIVNNYVVKGLDVINSEILARENSVEGATVARGDLNVEFFKKLGFAYGTSAEKPWDELTGADPALFIEDEPVSIRASETEITVSPDDEFVVEFVVGGVSVNDVSVLSTNTSIVAVKSVERVANVITVNAVALAGGSAEISATASGVTAACAVNVIARSIVVDKETLDLDEGASATVTFTVAGGDPADVVVESSDETIVRIASTEIVDKNVAVTVSCVKAGSAAIVGKFHGLEVSCSVSGRSAIAGVEADSSAISYDGLSVTAPDMEITLYTTSGIKVASSRNEVSVVGLAKGIYVVEAVGNGSRATMKIDVK